MQSVKNNQHGFTLLELLVVIAIIGILASVVLASLNSARSKGEDGTVQSNLNNMRAEAELHFNNNNYTYNNMCANPVIGAALASANEANRGGVVNCVDTNGSSQAAADATYSASNGWALEGQLVSDPTLFYCVDHTGASMVVTGSTLGTNDAQCGP